MALPLTPADLTTLQAFADLESQVMFTLTILVDKQAEYNALNAEAAKNQVQVTPNFSANTVAAQVAFPLLRDAITRKLQDSIVAPFSGV
jgi:hypothetical protein